jgi:putative addiction module killer protein
MIEIRQTKEFARWLADLADSRAATKIAQRLVRLEAGLFGDVKPVGGGISELRVDYGPGYRLYFTQTRTNSDRALMRRRQAATGS